MENLWVYLIFAALFIAPIALIRYGSGKPMASKKAGKVAMIYCGVAELLLLLMFGDLQKIIWSFGMYGLNAYALGYLMGSITPALICALVDYFILISGKDKSSKTQSVQEPPSGPAA